MRNKLMLMFSATILLTLCLVTGCAYRSAMKSGKKCFEAGMYDEAVDYFNTAAIKKPKSADAKVWLAKSKEMAAEHHYNKGLSHESIKAWADAASEYERVLSFIPDYKDSKSRLENVKYTNANENYQKGVDALNLKSWDEAISRFEAVQKLIPKDIKLAKDAYAGIQEAKEKAAEEHYQKGLDFEKKEQWQDALSEYQKVEFYKVGYKDVSIHAQVCHQALSAYFYQRGLECEEKEDLLGAFNNYRKATEHSPNYEDTKERLRNVSEKLAISYMRDGDKALDGAEDAELHKRQNMASKALSLYKTAMEFDSNCPGLSDKIRQAENLMIIRIAVLPFIGGNEKIAKEITNGIITSIVKSGSWKIKVVDRTQLDIVLNEIGLSSSGLVDINTIRKSGRIKGVDIIASGEITECLYRPERKSRTGTETKYNFETKTSYEVSYTEYTEERKATIKASVKLINAATSEIEWSDIIVAESSDSGKWRSGSEEPKMKTSDELFSIAANNIISRFSNEILRKY